MKNKANIGLALTITFALTLITGIMLHLKSHGILIQPRATLKAIHWIIGYAMTIFFCIHWSQFRKMLNAIRKKKAWFHTDTWLLIILFIATLLTGAVKQFTPVKIPHLGLWHYIIGLAMSITAIIHLIRGIPAWRRLRRHNR